MSPASSPAGEKLDAGRRYRVELSGYDLAILRQVVDEALARADAKLAELKAAQEAEPELVREELLGWSTLWRKVLVDARAATRRERPVEAEETRPENP
jgi:hypothetical protein